MAKGSWPEQYCCCDTEDPPSITIRPSSLSTLVPGPQGEPRPLPQTVCRKPERSGLLRLHPESWLLYPHEDQVKRGPQPGTWALTSESCPSA